MNFTVVLLIILGVFSTYIIVDETIDYIINSKLEKEFEIERKNYYGK